MLGKTIRMVSHKLSVNVRKRLITIRHIMYRPRTYNGVLGVENLKVQMTAFFFGYRGALMQHFGVLEYYMYLTRVVCLCAQSWGVPSHQINCVLEEGN